jgi:hypothetical protein
MIETKFEVAPEQYWKELTVEDAVLYCFALTIDDKVGWRLPTHKEANEMDMYGSCWNQIDIKNPDWNGYEYTTIPVRDLDK